MHEDVWSPFPRYKAVTLCIVEPLHGACQTWHCTFPFQKTVIVEPAFNTNDVVRPEGESLAELGRSRDTRASSVQATTSAAPCQRTEHAFSGSIGALIGVVPGTATGARRVKRRRRCSERCARTWRS